MIEENKNCSLLNECSKVDCDGFCLRRLALKDNISEKSEYVQHIKENVLNADIVIWDEVGTKGLTQFEHENILNIINARIDAGKANIYTSNLNDEDLHDAVGDRLYSRIALMSDNVVLEGADKRAL